MPSAPLPRAYGTAVPSGPASSHAAVAGLDAEGRADWFCLRLSYPHISSMVSDDEGVWLVLDNGRRALYAAAPGRARTAGQGSAWVTDVRSSMADPYPLEPERPDTPLGVSPGRRRSYELLHALYGATPAEVRTRLQRTALLGQPLFLSEPAAEAMRRADAVLRLAALADPSLKRLLRMDGGFAWRRIAGENRLSPHAFGIAFDISPDVATYWRWSSLRPHPMQKSYPRAIVEAFENEGFIWGGKWHEYDLMHFEYRPEIICKARMLRDVGNGGAAR
ncbi:MAG: M15 family metallopeptidase [Desulfovibrio desulfuricans]|jgi:hypothetical protein|nr:M15 family metallopeptidase [Desulfovibrio desulfuricans]